MLRDHIHADVMPDIAAMSTLGRLSNRQKSVKPCYSRPKPGDNGSVINADLGQIQR